MNDRLGVLGGMGPQATNTFYQLVIDRTDARTDQEHVNALILSDCQMPDRTAAILGTAEEQEAVFRRLLNMIRETAAALKRQGRTRPGILATDGTIRSGLYQKEFAALGITAVTPSPEAQKLVMSLIYDDVKAGRDGDPQKFDAIHQDLLSQGCDSGVLACTELSVFAVRRRLPPFYTDAMSVLAERAVLACRRPLRDIFI